ncbi:MAG: hypothetical protein A2Y73_00185 [Chloroflexi bacterium RBG_13_56_8]|nr:MAG: hypothetical protein A2Y73_00185 [Chloroflexi bacterium RBG_13_56_8]
MRQFLADQGAESLSFALVTLALGMLLILPLLATVGVSLRVTKSAEALLRSQYASDAGAEYGLWKIANDPLFQQTLIANEGTPQSVSMPQSINGETPSVRAVYVATEVTGGGSSTFEWAIWAGSETQNNTVNISGSGHRIYGGVHSNHKIRVAGSWHYVYGPVRYVTSLSISGSGHRIPYTGEPEQIDIPQPFPLSWDMADFEPGGLYSTDPNYHYHSGNWNIDRNGEVIEEGIHYVTARFRIRARNVVGHNVTIVARNIIDIQEPDYSFSPYIPNLTFFTDRSASSNVVTFSAGGDTGGITYAPQGRISLQDSAGTIYGAFLGNAVQIQDSGRTIRIPDITIPGGQTCGVYDIESSSGDITTTVRVRRCEGEDWEVLAWYLE